jgi:hypothetical protein
MFTFFYLETLNVAILIENKVKNIIRLICKEMSRSFKKMNSNVIMKNDILLIIKQILFICFLKRVNFVTLIVRSKTHVILINADSFFDSISAISNLTMFDLTIFILLFFKKSSAFKN